MFEEIFGFLVDWWFFFGFIVFGVFWVIVSSWNIIQPTERGLVKYFGHIREKLLTSENGFFLGLHFIPWFPGVELLRISMEMLEFPYKGDQDQPTWEITGTQLQVRSKDRQKLGVDMTAFLRFPHKKVKQLIEIVKAGVPYQNKGELRKWFEKGFRTDFIAIFGSYKYEEVMGGLKNQDLSDQINGRMQDPTRLFCKCGLFDNDPRTINVEGCGEAYLQIEYVHVQGPLGKALEEVATAKLEEEANRDAAEMRVQTTEKEVDVAKNIAKSKAEVINGPIRIGLKEWLEAEYAAAGATTDPEKKTVFDNLRTGGAYKRKEEELASLRSQDLAGGGTFDVNKNVIDVNSAGEPMKDSNMAAFLGTITAGLAAFAAAKGGGSQGGGGNRKGKGKGRGKGGNPPTPKPNAADDDDDDWDA